MNANINTFEIANVLIVILLLSILMRKRDVTTLLLVLFAYGTLHFGFTAVALTANDSVSLLIAEHIEGSGVLAKVATLVLLGVGFALLSVHAYRALAVSRGSENRIISYALLVMGALFCGYLLSSRQGDWLQLKNVISIEVMIAFLLVGYLGAIGAHTLNSAKIYSWGVGELLIFAAIDSIAIYEVFSHNAWSTYADSSGAVIYRASSILFNPNLFGFWASLVYLSCAYGMYAYKAHRNMMVWGMVLASIAIYMSGSRSAGYLLLVVLFIPALFLKKRFNWLTLLVLPMTILAIYAVAAWLAPFCSFSNVGWHELALLGDRLAAAPIYLINYVQMKTGSIFQFSVGVPSEVSIAIEGRFVGEGRDAGWMVLYQDAGWLGMAAILWGSFMLLWWGVRTYWAERSAASVYALAVLCYCLSTGLVMRMQIFPVWLFISLFLTPCLFYWRQSVVQNPLPICRDAHVNS